MGKKVLIFWIISSVALSILYCAVFNDYDVRTEVKDGQYEHTYYSVPEATLNTIVHKWYVFLGIIIICLFVSVDVVVDDEWDEANKNRYGEGFTYTQRKDIDKNLGVRRGGQYHYNDRTGKWS